jgi:hypothetical protein
MTKMKALGAAIILSTVFAAPVFARDSIGPGNGLEPQLATYYRSTYRVPDDLNFRGAYNLSGRSFDARPLTNEERRNLEDFGRSGRDSSRVGGEDPYFHPGG